MNTVDSPNINHLWARLIVEELIRTGVEYFCISPGSRSSPLATAVALNKKAKSFVHFDERGVAFHALGYVSAAKRPCALICTSGTAAANFFPAIIEASKKKLPLVVLTADRPPELRYTGANQTIDQVKLYNAYVRWEFDVPCPTTEIKPEFVLTTIDQAVYRAKGVPPGPVHLNCMYREPLAPVNAQEDFAEYCAGLAYWEKQPQAFTHYIAPEQTFSEIRSKALCDTLEDIKNGVIVTGKLSSITEQKAVLKLAEALNWPVFPDIASGMRLGAKHKNIIPYFDQILLSDAFTNSFPFDGVVQIGGRITSKRWNDAIDQAKLKHYIMILNHPLRNDPGHKVTLRMEGSVSAIYESISRKLQRRQGNKVLGQLQEASQKVHEVIHLKLNKVKKISEPGVAHLISEHIPSEHSLFLANSMPIRDVDMYARSDKNAVTLGANRGASGIDGNIATAAGFSAGLEQPVTLLIGDLALLHDLNSLAMTAKLKQPLILIVINNNGGGIFSFLPVAEFGGIFEQYFGTPHDLNFEGAANMFRLKYYAPQDQNEFTRSYREALRQKNSVIIEVRTNREENATLHRDLQRAVREALAKPGSARKAKTAA